MKKILIILSLLILTGCTVKVEVEKPSIETIKSDMINYASIYYNTYVYSKIDPVPNQFNVSISDLKNANDKLYADYNLDNFINCTDESKVILNLNLDGTIESEDTILDCK